MSGKPISKKAESHINSISCWYQKNGAHFGDFRKHDQKAYSWLMYFRKRVRESKPETEQILSIFREKGVPACVFLSGPSIQPNHIHSINKRIAQIHKFYKENGHYRIPLRYPNGLGKWMQRSRELYKKDPSHPRIQALTQEFPLVIFDPIKTKFNDPVQREKNWMKQFRLLEKYAQQYKTTRIPRKSHDPDPARKKLAIWVYKQRMSFGAGKMSIERKKLLDGINFDFSSRRK